MYDRVHPSVGAAILDDDDELTFEQNLERGVALAMQAAEEQAAVYDAELEQTLADCVGRGELEPLFEPVVDPEAAAVLGYRSSVRGPFYSPLRLPGRAARRGAAVDAAGRRTASPRARPRSAPPPAWAPTTCSSWAARPASCPTRRWWR